MTVLFTCTFLRNVNISRCMVTGLWTVSLGVESCARL